MAVDRPESTKIIAVRCPAPTPSQPIHRPPKCIVSVREVIVETDYRARKLEETSHGINDKSSVIDLVITKLLLTHLLNRNAQKTNKQTSC